MMHVMVDEPDAVEDRMIASHIVNVHRQRDALTFDRVPFKMDDMQRYIKYARAIKPELTDHVRPDPNHASLTFTPDSQIQACQMNLCLLRPNLQALFATFAAGAAH